MFFEETPNERSRDYCKSFWVTEFNMSGVRVAIPLLYPAMIVLFLFFAIYVPLKLTKNI